jgi:hypothetical protein
MNCEDFKKVLDELQVYGFGANLAGGKIHWTDKEGKVVAHAEIKAVLSWAATNNSAMWAYAISQFQDAKVPVIKPKNVKSDYIGDINDAKAAEMASEVAAEAEAEFVYRASNGANGLYLAVFNFKKESIELNAEDIARKRKSAIGYVVQMLGNISEILSNKKRADEAINLLKHFDEALSQQLQQLSKDEDLGEEGIKLKKSIQTWLSMMPEKRDDVLAFLKQAASKWQRML